MKMRKLWITQLAVLGIALGCGRTLETANSAQKAGSDRTKNRLANDARAAVAPNLLGKALDRKKAQRFAGEETTEGDDQPATMPNPEPCEGEDCAPTSGEEDDFPTISRELTFNAWREAQGMLRHPLNTDDMMHEITLRANEVDHSLSFVQAGQRSAVDEFIQGVGLEDIVENFAAETDRPLDILLVLDNGCSMNREAKNMADKLAPLLDGIAATDWQIGIVTTDPSQSCLRALVKKGDANARDLFADAVKVGSQGSLNPRALLQAVRSLSGECLDRPWLRPNSNVELLFVSDKDNCIDGKACRGKEYAKASYLTGYLSSIRTIGKNARVHGVYMPPGVERCDCKSAERPGAIFAEIVGDTGGSYGSICNEDYAPAIAGITNAVTGAMRQSFTLARDPAANTVHVFIDDQELKTGFTVTGRIVTLDKPLAAQSKLKIVYRDYVSTLATRFKLRYPPVPDSLIVTINGVDAKAGSYTLDAAAPAIEFKEAPAPRARIAIGYKRNMALQDRFELGAAVINGTLSVSIDGTATTAFKLNAADGIVTLDQAPKENSAIVFEWKAEGSPILRYPVLIPEDQATAFTAYDKATSAELKVAYTKGYIDVDPADFVSGRVIVIKYKDSSADRFTVTLPQDPIAGSIMASAGGKSCSMAPELMVNGRELTFSGCKFPADATEVAITYTYKMDVKEFVFDVPNFPAPNDYQKWTVWVNDVETMDYMRNGKTISFDKPLPWGAVVRVRLMQRAPDPALPPA